MLAVSALHRRGLPALVKGIHEAAFGAHSRISLGRVTSPQLDSMAVSILGRGVILDLVQRRGEGTAVHVLMQSGAISVGSYFLAGLTRGRVRSIRPVDGDTDVNDASIASRSSSGSSKKKDAVLAGEAAVCVVSLESDPRIKGKRRNGNSMV